MTKTFHCASLGLASAKTTPILEDQGSATCPITAVAQPLGEADRRALVRSSDIEGVLAFVRRGFLWVQPDGTIWRLRKANGKLKTVLSRAEFEASDGYLRVSIRGDGCEFQVPAHRLVWRVLRGNIPPAHDINHLDGNKTNNHPSNLETATRSQNVKHAYDTGLIPARPNRAREMAREVWRLRSEGLTNDAIGARLKLSRSVVYRALRIHREDRDQAAASLAAARGEARP